jgi:hypothetical protein
VDQIDSPPIREATSAMIGRRDELLNQIREAGYNEVVAAEQLAVEPAAKRRPCSCWPIR